MTPPLPALIAEWERLLGEQPPRERWWLDPDPRSGGSDQLMRGAECAENFVEQGRPLTVAFMATSYEEYERDAQDARARLIVFLRNHAPALLAALKDADREICMWRKNLEDAQADNAANADALMLALKEAERLQERVNAAHMAAMEADGKSRLVREAVKIEHPEHGTQMHKTYHPTCCVCAALAPSPVEPPTENTR